MLCHTVSANSYVTYLLMYFQLRAGVRWLAVRGSFPLVKVVCLDDVSRAAGGAADGRKVR